MGLESIALSSILFFLLVFTSSPLTANVRRCPAKAAHHSRNGCFLVYPERNGSPNLRILPWTGFQNIEGKPERASDFREENIIVPQAAGITVYTLFNQIVTESASTRRSDFFDI